MDDKKRRSTTDANLGREKDREGRRQRACARTQRLELDYSVGAGVGCSSIYSTGSDSDTRRYIIANHGFESASFYERENR